MKRKSKSPYNKKVNLRTSLVVRVTIARGTSSRITGGELEEAYQL